MKKIVIPMMLVLLSSFMVAATEVVQNPEFDDGDLNWSAESQWGGPSFYTDGTDTIVAIGGWGNDVDWWNASVWQNTGATFESDTVYTMNVAWRDSEDKMDTIGLAIQDVTSDWTDVASAIISIPPAQGSEWVVSTLILDTTSNPSVVGNTIGVSVRLTSGTGAWFHIDSISLLKQSNTIQYGAPDNGATLIPVELNSAENDLVFTVIDPNIVDVEVYLSPNDPNAPDLIKTINSVGTSQQTVTLETELSTDLSYETLYYWQVIGYEPNDLPGATDVIPVPGSVWTFTTAPETPLITSGASPAYTAVEAGEPNIVLTANGINGVFKWYKDGVAIDDAEGVYAGTETGTLTIYDIQLADEGDYIMKVTNSPFVAESTPGRVMIHRQTSYYDFDSITTLPDGNDVFTDSIDGYHAVLMQDSASAGLPTASDANQLDLPVAFPGTNGNGLLLDNSDHATDPNGQYLEIYPGVVDYEDTTISLWAHPKSVAVWARLFDFGTGQDNTMWLTPDTGDSYDPRFSIGINGGGQEQMNPDLDSWNWLTPGSWHYVVITLNGDEGRFYVNGEYRGFATVTGNPIDLNATLNWIGKSQFDDPEFDGLIDELKIYNYALSGVEIGQEYLTYADPTGHVCDLETNDFGNVDIDFSCKVDLGDIAILASRWLEDYWITLP